MCVEPDRAVLPRTLGCAFQNMIMIEVLAGGGHRQPKGIVTHRIISIGTVLKLYN